MAPRISIAVPLFNKSAYVQASLASVARQSFTDYEIIVVDDGSTDDGASVVQAMKLLNLRLISQSNAGVSAARNRCLAEASSEFVAFLDADDIWREDHLKHLWEMHVACPDAGLLANSFLEVNNIENHPASSHAVTYRKVDDFVADAATGRSWVFTSAAMVHRERCLSIGGFEVGENRGEDIDLWIRMGLQFPVVISDYIGSLYRRVDSSLTTSVLVLEPDVAMRRVAALLNESPMSATRQRNLKELHNRMAIANATDCLIRGHGDAARKFLVSASDTRIYRWRWKLLRLLSVMPPSVIAVLARMRNRAKSAREV